VTVSTGTVAATRGSRGRGREAGGPTRSGWLSGGRELGVLAGLYVAYSLTRVLASDDLAAAQDRARDIGRLEDALHLDVESWLNHATSDLAWLAVPMDFWYAVLHYLVTPVALGWLYLRRRSDYGRARTALVVSSVLALGCYLLLPTAPPRLTGGSSYVDTLALFAHVGWWSEHASAPSGLGGLTNELAAMPSLHVGWAIWAVWAVRGRLLAYLYPAGTALVVVCTGNHWVLDCVVGLLLTLAGIGAATWWSPARSEERRPRGLGHE